MNGKRVYRDDKFVVLKVYDNLTRDEVFTGKALLSDKSAVNKLLDDAASKGFFLR